MVKSLDVVRDTRHLLGFPSDSCKLWKNFARELVFKVIPTKPPAIIMGRLICSNAWSAPIAQKGTHGFLLTTQLPQRNSSFMSDYFSDSMSAR
jgi:hypothetical protein